MATGLEARGSARQRVWQFAGVENPTSKAVAAATTLADSDSRLVAADTTAAAFSLTLPASPYNGMEFRVYDGAAAGSWHTNNLTIDGNGNSIVVAGAASAATVVLSQRSGAVDLRYDSTSDLWHAMVSPPGSGVTLTAPVIAGGLTASGSASNTFAGSTGTFLTSTGLNTIGGDLLMAAGKIIGTGTPQALSGAGAVNVTTFATLFTSTGGGQALTLANGTQAGQIKFVVHVVDGGSGVITPTTATGFTTLTLTAVYDWGAMIWDGAAWRPLAYGGTAAFA